MDKENSPLLVSGYDMGEGVLKITAQDIDEKYISFVFALANVAILQYSESTIELTLLDMIQTQELTFESDSKALEFHDDYVDALKDYYSGPEAIDDPEGSELT